MISKIKKVIKNPEYILLKIFGKYMNDDKYLTILYKYNIGKKLDLSNVKTFNEKLQWLKINDRKLEYIQLVDKYEVRKYISKVIGNSYLIPLIGVYDRFEEIDFNKLPDKFVLKCTHDSGSVFICKDKKNFNIRLVKNKINKALKKNYYYSSREWPYKNVKPRIICETFMENSNDDLIDYKFFCFNGEVKTILVCSERFSSNGLKETFFNTKWEIQNFKRSNCNISEIKIDKPKNLDQMIVLAKKLSENKTFIRVDFYEIKNKIYFGELTFFPASGLQGFEPEYYDNILGDWINIKL